MMSTESVTLLLAYLAVLSQLTVLAVLSLTAMSRWSSSASSASSGLQRILAPQAAWLAFLVAVVSTAGSLYFSEVAHFTPCRLCWYQRFAMYPLVLILGVLALRGSHLSLRAVIMIPLVGASISGYHMGVERFPSLESTTCDPTNPCSLIWVERFGYLTIPTMAASAFLLIATLLWVLNRSPAAKR